MLHLQCATGESTAQLAELGALVTGVDISAEATAVARERVPNGVFLEADVQQLPLQLERGRFDLVYTGGGIFHWLHDLDAWAHGVASALKPGGMLPRVRRPPLSRPASTRARTGARTTSTRSPIADVRLEALRPTGRAGAGAEVRAFLAARQIVTAVAGAGLTIRSLEEFSTIYETYWRAKDPRVPGQFVLIATKPKEGAKAAKTPRRAPRP